MIIVNNVKQGQQEPMKEKNQRLDKSVKLGVLYVLSNPTMTKIRYTGLPSICLCLKNVPLPKDLTVRKQYIYSASKYLYG